MNSQTNVADIAVVRTASKTKRIPPNIRFDVAFI